ncbi:hypothetical protein [Deinococcus multiflagellatus]|uniref:Uncharacterized protein n=1 Tax=Deinococcus multiflagellatus TaxID=1656887 RepID=A0ABW1ZLR3_9DEIO|nr:hypothetical protein [Deinococcus multiflagellatus]MBZ9715167.1 hypothetical protein [Deinococcus multiflagellatus]
MSELTSTNRHGGAGRALLWVAIALTVALLGFVTIFVSQRNPIYSDREAGGISKFKFIEACKEVLEDTEALTVSAQGQTIPLKTLVQQGSPLKPGDKLHADLNAESPEIVRAAQLAEEGGWTMTLPVNIAVHSGERVTTLGQLPMQCRHDKRTGKTTAQLGLPG